MFFAAHGSFYRSRHISPLAQVYFSMFTLQFQLIQYISFPVHSFPVLLWHAE